MIALPLALGALTWSFSEYTLHRWVGHDAKSKTDFADEHRTHHAQRGYFAATSKKAAHAVPLVLAGLALGWLTLGAAGAAYVVGFAVTYVAYEALHRRLHTHGPRGPLGRYLRRHHFAHHFSHHQSRLSHTRRGLREAAEKIARNQEQESSRGVRLLRSDQ